MKRIEAGDPAAMTQMGTIRFEEGDYDGAVKYWKKAAEFGDLDVHHQLGVAYERGMVSRRMMKRQFIIGKWLPLEVIPLLDTILDVTRRGMVELIEH